MLYGLACDSNNRYEPIFEPVQKLEKYMIIDVSSQVLSEVADVTASAARIGVQVGWMNKDLGKIRAIRNIWTL